jgi:hypothetical protein
MDDQIIRTYLRLRARLSDAPMESSELDTGLAGT